MKRRSFIRKTASVPIAAAAVSGCLSDGNADEQENQDSGKAESGGTEELSNSETISNISFYSPASQMSTSAGSLDDEFAVVRAEASAVCLDTNDSGAYIYPEGAEPPLVSEDGKVVGFGSTELVSDSNGGFEHGNEQFLLNVWDEKTSGDVLLWDEGHSQYWTLDRYERFKGYAEEAGYELRTTTEVSSDIDGAAGVVITSPSDPFSESELETLRSFVEGGGAVFLFDQSDYQGHDETENLNEIAKALGIGFRFNSDQVNDSSNNAGGEFIPLTSNFEDSLPYFDERSSTLEPEEVTFEKGSRYECEVTDVADGDTIDVSFGEGSVETLRLLGIDTSEVPPTDVKPEEWTGIDSEDHLREWAQNGSEFAEERFSVGDTVEVAFDEVEPTRGEYGRILCYVYYDSTGDGEPDTHYNREIVSEGYARVYSSGFGRHDDFAAEETEAIESDRGVWSGSDIDSLDPYRNQQFDEMFFPEAVEVDPGSGEGVVSVSGSPVACIDEDARLAAVGGPIVHEDYESDYEFGTDTSEYGNYPFLTNLIYYLSEKEGDVFFEGGHRQFSTEGSMTLEDAAWYRRHVEGTGRRLRQVNDLTETLSDVDAAGLIVSPPAEPYTDAETEAVSRFVSEGGSVVLLGSAASDNHGNLNQISEALGADVRLTDSRVTDGSNNLTSPEIPLTSEFNGSYPLFGPHR
jgi:endonuclease YncB( thermonuclease family)